MKTRSLLFCWMILLAGCKALEKQPVAGESVADLLKARIRAEQEVVFIPWNGKQREDGSNCTFRFQQGSQIRFEFVATDIRDYVGSFSFLGDNLIEAKIKSDTRNAYVHWPRMVLRREREDLLLYRADGHTWWHDLYPDDGVTTRRDDWPFYPDSRERFWPLRASKKTKPTRI